MNDADHKQAQAIVKTFPPEATDGDVIRVLQLTIAAFNDVATNGVPVNPDIVYARDWQGWDHFLSTSGLNDEAEAFLAAQIAEAPSRKGKRRS